MEKYPESVINAISQNMKNNVGKEVESSVLKNPRIWTFSILSNQFDILKYNYFYLNNSTCGKNQYFSNHNEHWFLVKNNVSVKNLYPKTILLSMLSLLATGSFFSYKNYNNKK